MADQLNVLVICGSLRKKSFNAALARTLPELAPPQMKFVEAPDFEVIPPYNADLQCDLSVVDLGDHEGLTSALRWLA